MKRISVTTLESYRKLRSGDSYLTQDSFIEGLRTPFEGNNYTKVGTAFHSIVELGTPALLDRADGRYDVIVGEERVTFSPGQVAAILAYRLSLPLSLHEVWVGRVFHTSVMDIWVHGRMDLLHGIDVHDIKTKYGRVNVGDYEDSAQWRLYLDLAQLDRFVFDLFMFHGDIDGLDVSSLHVDRWGEIECVRYAGMADDNSELVDDFASFVVRHGLVDCLKDHTKGEN